MNARGRPIVLSRHAWDGMGAERPPVDEHDVRKALEASDSDDGKTALRWIAGRTILVRYEELEDEIYVRSVSTTKRRLGA